MNYFRICVLLVMVFTILLMICLPGLQDTKQMATAWNHYHDTPNDTTRKELEDARIADRKQMIIMELVLGTFLVLCGVGFVKAGKKQIK